MTAFPYVLYNLASKFMKDYSVAMDDEFGILLLLESYFVCILTGS